MIATENQYRVTKDRLDRFTATLRAVETAANLDDPLQRGRIEALRTQVDRLAAELREYEALRSGIIKEFTADTLADLPITLIKARVARGLTQSALGELVGVKPQQIQRWETERYRKTSLERLAQIARALNVRISERVQLAEDAPVAVSSVRQSLRALGFPSEVIERRLMPTRLLAGEERTLVDELDARLDVVVGMNARVLVSSGATLRPAAMRFKVPASAEQQRTRAYSHYVAALCTIVAKCIPSKPRMLPIDWRGLRQSLFPADNVSLTVAVETCWTWGVAVLPLNDSIAFHGACWRVGERTVVVLKQTSREEFRWLFDLVHELYHAATEPIGEDLVIIEADETSPERRTSTEERRAQRFAAEVLTNGRTEELTSRIAALADNCAERLKAATVRVATESGLPVGLLANLLAHRLAQSGIEWWGTAANLQPSGGEPWKVVRDLFLEHADLSQLPRVEFDLLMQSLETDRNG